MTGIDAEELRAAMQLLGVSEITANNLYDLKEAVLSARSPIVPECWMSLLAAHSTARIPAALIVRAIQENQILTEKTGPGEDDFTIYLPSVIAALGETKCQAIFCLHDARHVPVHVSIGPDSPAAHFGTLTRMYEKLAAESEGALHVHVVEHAVAPNDPISATRRRRHWLGEEIGQDLRARIAQALAERGQE